MHKIVGLEVLIYIQICSTLICYDGYRVNNNNEPFPVERVVSALHELPVSIVIIAVLFLVLGNKLLLQRVRLAISHLGAQLS